MKKEEAKNNVKTWINIEILTPLKTPQSKTKQLKITGSHQTLHNITYFLLAFELTNFYETMHFISMFSLKLLAFIKNCECIIKQI